MDPGPTLWGQLRGVRCAGRQPQGPQGHSQALPGLCKAEEWGASSAAPLQQQECATTGCSLILQSSGLKENNNETEHA